MFLLVILQFVYSQCNTNPLFSAAWFTTWKNNQSNDVQTVVTALEANTGNPTSGAMDFCQNNTVFTQTCCTSTQFSTLAQNMHKKYKPYIDKGTPNCQLINNLDKKIPKNCLKSGVSIERNATTNSTTSPNRKFQKNVTTSGNATIRPPPGNMTFTELKETYGQDSKMVLTMANSSKGMVGIVNGVMGMMRTFTCIICAGPNDFSKIFTGTTITLNQQNYTKFINNMTDDMYQLREADSNCSQLSDELTDNLTNTSKLGCSNVKNIVKNRKKSDNGNKCTDNTTCAAAVNSFSFGDPDSLLGPANLNNDTITDQSASLSRLMSEVRMLQTSTTSSGGVAITTSGSDDIDSYNGVSASFGLKCLVSMILLSLVTML